ASASASVEPPSMFCLTSVSMFLKRMLRWPPAMISKDCTIGTPAAIMVAIWRLKIATSRGLTRLPAAPNSGLAFSFTVCGFMPCRRSSALTRLALRACSSPFILVPRLSSAVHSYTVNCLTEARAAPTERAVGLLTVVAVAIAVSRCELRSGESESVLGDAVDLGQAGHALPYFPQRGIAQVAHAAGACSFGDLHRAAAFQDDALDLVVHRHHFVDAHAALVAIAAARASAGVEQLQALGDLFVGEAFRQQRCFRQLQRLLAVVQP